MAKKSSNNAVKKLDKQIKDLENSIKEEKTETLPVLDKKKIEEEMKKPVTKKSNKKGKFEKKENSNKQKKNKEKIREKNLIKFFIIMGSFVGIVVIVFIGIMINIACKTKVIEDDSDDEEYKNVGVIRDVGNEEEN